MKNAGLCVVSLLSGAIVGSVVTMLVTPKSGKEWRDSIRAMVNEELESVRCHCKEHELGK